MNNYIIDPFIYNPPNIDPREIFNIIDYEDIIDGRYLISIYGRVYDTLYNGFLTKKKIRLRTWSGSIFYENYCLFNLKDHTQEYKSVPNIVLSTFKGYNTGYRIIHLNGDELDDNLYNLKYGEYIDIPDKNLSKENKDKSKPTIKRKLDEDKIHLICKLLEKNIHPSMIAEKTGIKWRDVYNIKSLVTNKDISKQYSFSTNRGGIYNEEYYNRVAEELGIL